MKKFLRHRTSKEIKRACRDRGFPFSDKKYNEGSDYITFTFRYGNVRCFVCYSTVNGRAFGELAGVPKSQWFSTDSTEHENRPWFKALLDFIYVGDPAACAH